MEIIRLIQGECSTSYVYISNLNGGRWILSGLHRRGEGREREVLPKDLGECKNRWDLPWVQLWTVLGEFLQDLCGGV